MKSQFQDIIPPEKRTIRNVPLPRDSKSNSSAHKSKASTVTRRHKKDIEEHTDEVQISINNEEALDPWTYETKSDFSSGNIPRMSPMSKIFVWFVAIICLIVFFVSLSWLFSGATIRVSLKKISVPVEQVMQFSLSPEESQIGYSTVTLTDKEFVEVDATGEKDVSQKSSGTIVIYNNYSSAPQKLIAGTRFATSNGLIYRIKSAVTVPGKKGDTPGSIQAVVEADKPGSEYNIDLSDFVIPGFEGDPRYKYFYARSKTAFDGGQLGKVPVISEEIRQKNIENLKLTLQSRLRDKIHTEVPESYTTISGLNDTSYLVKETLVNENRARIEVSEVSKIYAINTNQLAKKILDISGTTVLQGDSFSIDSSSASATISSLDKILTASLTGVFVVNYSLDVDKFKNDLLRKTKNDLPTIVNNFYPQITTISTEIKPFWRSSIPSDPKRITVIKE